MPLLAREATLFPEHLFDDTQRREGQWWVVHTRPRAEKSFARRLLAREVAFFLPLHEHILAGSRPRSSHLPLFPGYVFLFGKDEDRRLALETGLVVQCLSVADQVQMLDDLRRVHILLDAQSKLTPEQVLQPGAPVRIVAGSLAGLIGKVVRRGRELRFVVEVHFLQSGVSVEVESWMIKPLERPFTIART